MVNNVFVQCNACKMKMNLRTQMGFFDIPLVLCQEKVGHI